MLDFAMKIKYLAENPAAEVKHFNELRERPTRRMLTLDEEKRILGAAPVHLRVAIILLSQTGGRTYSEDFSLRWSQVDFEQKVILWFAKTLADFEIDDIAALPPLFCYNSSSHVSIYRPVPRNAGLARA